MPVVASVTGSPTITPGLTWEGMTGTVYQWSGDGSITFSTGGTVYPLVVAGGGAGGIGGEYERAAGGGGGGMVGGYPAHPDFSFLATASTYAIAVGLGGVPSTTTRGVGPSGGNSSITGTNAPPEAIGGGGGATQNDGPLGGSGGSSGGNTYGNGINDEGGLATDGQGNRGSRWPDTAGTSGSLGGGGGGAGAPGEVPTASGQALRGGDGLPSSITGVEVYYAGGAGGSMGLFDAGLGIAQGGLGGGGRSGTATYAQRSGVDGTGGGGAPGVNSTNDALRTGKGGDGTVILFVPDEAAPAAVTYTGPTRASLGSGSSGSWSVDIGAESADRLVLLSIVGQATTPPGFTSATINGQSTTTAILSGSDAGGDDVHYWALIEAPSGTGSQTLSFVLGGSLSERAGSAWVLRGADAASVVSQFTLDSSFAFQASTTLTVADGGAIFGASAVFSGESPSFASSTATPNVSTSIEMSERGHRALDLDGLTAGSFTFSQNTNFSYAMSAVAFAPASGGAPEITGALDAQETGSDSASVAADVVVSGVVAAQESGADSASVSVGVVVSASVAVQENGPDAASVAGAVGVAAQLAAQESGADVAAITGAVADPAILVTLDAQEAGADSAAVTVAVRVAGALGGQEAGSDLAAVAGQVAVAAELAGQETGQDSASGSGTVAVAGAVAGQEAGGDVAAVTGAVAVSGALAAQEAGQDVAVIQAGSGRVVTIAAQEAGVDQASVSGAVAVAAAVAAQEVGSDSASISATVSDPGLSATVEAQEAGADSASVVGAVAVAAAVAAQEAGTDQASVVARVAVVAELAASETGADVASIRAFLFSGRQAFAGQSGTFTRGASGRRASEGAEGARFTRLG